MKLIKSLISGSILFLLSSTVVLGAYNTSFYNTGFFNSFRNKSEIVLEGHILKVIPNIEIQDSCNVTLNIDYIYRKKEIFPYEVGDNLTIDATCDNSESEEESFQPLEYPSIDVFKENDSIRVYLNPEDDNSFHVIPDGVVFLDNKNYVNFDPEDVTPLIGSVDLPFSDVLKDNPFYEPVYWLWLNKIITGYPDATYRLENPITRAELLKIVIESEPNNLSEIKDQISNFKDVSLNDWFYVYVNYAYNNSWVKGYLDDVPLGQNIFKPNASITRAEALKIILKNENLQEERPIYLNDVKESDWFYLYVKYAVIYDLIDSESDFYPNEEATRSFVSTVIYRLHQKKLKDIQDQYTVDIDDIHEGDTEETVDENAFNPENYPMLDFGETGCAHLAVQSGSDKYVVWSYDDESSSALYMFDTETKETKTLMDITGSQFRNNPSLYVPLTIKDDQETLFVYKEQCLNGGYNLFNYFADELLTINLRTGEKVNLMNFVSDNNLISKFLNISFDTNQIAYFYTENPFYFEPYKTWIRVENLKTGKTSSFEMPFFDNQDQQFGEGFFSPNNQKIAYMISAGKTPDADTFSILLLDLKTGKTTKIIDSPEYWNGEWILEKWKDNETLILRKTHFEDNEEYLDFSEIKI